jgi:hypothetical protein
MKKTNKPNPLKFFNDNKAMAYKKAGGEMGAFKKSLPKAQIGIAGIPKPGSIPKTSSMIGPQTEMEAVMSNIKNYQPPIPFANKESGIKGYEKIKGNTTYGKGNSGYDTNTKPLSRPNNPVNYREEIQKKYGTGPDGTLTPDDIMKLKARGILKKGGPVKRKK